MNSLPDKLTRPTREIRVNDPGTKELLFVFLLFLAVSLSALFFINFHSPFYRYSVNPDSNTYIDLARAMRHGLLPYRDVFDHKGPLLYLINFLATVLSPKSLTGLYWILGFSLAVFLWYGYRIARMFLSILPALTATFPLLFFSVGNRILYSGGGSTEEYLMPCMMACIFYLIRFTGCIDKQDGLSLHRFFLDSVATGFFCGIMLWIKYTTIPTVGLAFLFLYVCLFVAKKSATALRSFLGIVCGAIISSLPCLLFLWKNDLFKDMWSAYIRFNYSYNNSDLAKNHTEINLYVLRSAIPIMIASILGLILFYAHQKKKIISKIGFAGLMIFIFSSIFFIVAFGRYYPYYFLTIIPPLIFATIAVIRFFLTRRFSQRLFEGSIVPKIIVTGALALCFLCLTIFSAAPFWGRISFRAPKTNTEYHADAINNYWAQNGDGSEPAILFFLGMDRGILQLCDTYPQNRFFYAPIVGDDQVLYIAKEQLKYIEEGTVDFIYVDKGDMYADFFMRANPSYQPISIPGDYPGKENDNAVIYAKTETRADS